ncbi:hypothetical protein EMIT0196P_50224 [Pseudomonas chlororaphis]
MPIAQNLYSTSRRGKKTKSNARRPAGRPGFGGDPCSRCRRLRSAAKQTQNHAPRSA